MLCTSGELSINQGIGLAFSKLYIYVIAIVSPWPFFSPSRAPRPFTPSIDWLFTKLRKVGSSGGQEAICSVPSRLDEIYFPEKNTEIRGPVSEQFSGMKQLHGEQDRVCIVRRIYASNISRCSIPSRNLIKIGDCQLNDASCKKHWIGSNIPGWTKNFHL